MAIGTYVKCMVALASVLGIGVNVSDLQLIDRFLSNSASASSSLSWVTSSLGQTASSVSSVLSSISSDNEASSVCWAYSGYGYYYYSHYYFCEADHHHIDSDSMAACGCSRYPSLIMSSWTLGVVLLST
eukprot:5958459-Amphidinium_carterae.1